MVTANATEAEPLPNLEAHRPVILLRSVLVGAASALPLPGLGELLTSALSRGLVYHVVQLSFVDIEEDAVDTLLGPSPKEQRFGVLTAIGSLGSLLRRQKRVGRMFIGLAVINGVTEASRVFHLATLLDHYCSHHHHGPTIQVVDAQRLRKMFDDATRAAQRELGGAVLSEVVGQSVKLGETVGKWGWSVIRRQPPPAIHPSLSEVAHGIRSWAADLSVRRYFGRITDTFDKKLRAGGQTP